MPHSPRSGVGDVRLLGLEKKLGNTEFRAKAPPEVVSSEEKRRGELEAERAKLWENLAGL